MASANDSRTRKKQQFSEAARNKNNRTIFLVAGLGLILVLFLYGFSSRRSAPAANRASPVNVVNGLIAIPVSELQDGKARFFDYTTTSNQPMRFFAIKSSDGVYRAAADACDVCYRSKMGYHQEGDDMVCNKCGRHFRSKDVNVITGGCNPDGVPVRVEGDKLLIASADLDSRAAMF